MPQLQYRMPVSEDESFFGRQDILEELLSFLRPTLIIGGEKIGKTSLLRWLGSRLPRDWPGPIPLQVVDLDLLNPAHASADRLVSEVHSACCSYFRNHHGVTQEDLPDNPSPSLVDLLDLLAHQRNQGRTCLLVLLVDNLERPVVDNVRLQVFQILRSMLDRTTGGEICVIASSSSRVLSTEVQSLTSTLISRLTPLFLGPLSRDETAQLLASAPEYRDENQQPHVSVLNAIYSATGGHPYLLQRLLSEVAASGQRPNIEATESAAHLLLSTEVRLFNRWIESMTLEEITYLQALALRVGFNPAGWPLSPSARSRLRASGLVAEQTADPTKPRHEQLCGLFFEWLRAGARRLVDVTEHVPSHVEDVIAVIHLLTHSLRAAIGGRTPTQECDVQDVVHALLIADGRTFDREVVVSRIGDTRHAADFYSAELGVAIEVTLLQRKDQLSGLKARLIQQIMAHRVTCDSVVVVVYDLTGCAEAGSFYGSDGDMAGVHYVIVRHQPECTNSA